MWPHEPAPGRGEGAQGELGTGPQAAGDNPKLQAGPRDTSQDGGNGSSRRFSHARGRPLKPSALASCPKSPRSLHVKH